MVIMLGILLVASFSFGLVMMSLYNDLVDEYERRLSKVVERLERAKDDFSGGTLQEEYYWRGIEKAIEIVKGGAV